jgi:xanthine dehydrogenase accessory factor
VNWPGRALREIARHGAVVRVTVIRAEGSTPREIGAAMLVGPAGIEDTIGGGALEFEAIAHARGLLATAGDASPWRREWRDFALGPSLGQCCGGFVRLMFELFTQDECPALERIASSADPARMVLLRPIETGAPLLCALSGDDILPAASARAARQWLAAPQRPDALLIPGRKGEPDWVLEPLAPPLTPLILHGAGHVGRALIRVLDGLPFAVTWADIDAGRFPESVPPDVAARIAPDPAGVIAEAPAGAIHLVMTHSHPLDLAICHAVLARGNFRFLGLIGSETKRARFLKRLRELGMAEERLARLTCPIGLPGVKGKQPAIIAVAIAAQLLAIAGADSPVAEKL